MRIYDPCVGSGGMRLGEHKLMESNRVATDLLLRGTVVEGVPEMDGGRDQTVRYIDFEHPENNDFLSSISSALTAPAAVASSRPTSSSSSTGSRSS
jgi:hypothetical protein